MAQDNGQGAFSSPQPGMKIRPANRAAANFDQKAILTDHGQRILNNFQIFIGGRHHGRLAGFCHGFLPSDI